MFSKDKRSFFERITGSVPYEEEEEEVVAKPVSKSKFASLSLDKDKTASKEKDYNRKIYTDESPDSEMGELAIDTYATENEVIVQTMLAGVAPESINISVNRDRLAINATREQNSEFLGGDIITQELYWGTIGCSIVLPAEVEADNVDANYRNGLLTIRMPKIDKEKMHKVKIKAS